MALVAPGCPARAVVLFRGAAVVIGALHLADDERMVRAGALLVGPASVQLPADAHDTE